MGNVKTIIGIAGASGAGKSRLAKELFDRIRRNRTRHDITILNEDCYYHRRDDLSFPERETINYDHPEAIEHELLIEHLVALRNGQSVDVPRYNYAEHNRDAQTDRVDPSTVLILEGILILHRPELRDLLDLRIFVDVPMDICLSRRLRRDIEERGRSLDSVLSQYHLTVRPMFFEYIDPSKEHADIIIPRGGENVNAIDVLENHLDRVLADS